MRTGKLFYLWERTEKRQWWLAVATIIEEDLTSLVRAEEEADNFVQQFHKYLTINCGLMSVFYSLTLICNPLTLCNLATLQIIYYPRSHVVSFRE